MNPVRFATSHPLNSRAKLATLGMRFRVRSILESTCCPTAPWTLNFRRTTASLRQQCTIASPQHRQQHRKQKHRSDQHRSDSNAQQQRPTARPAAANPDSDAEQRSRTDHGTTSTERQPSAAPVRGGKNWEYDFRVGGRTRIGRFRTSTTRASMSLLEVPSPPSEARVLNHDQKKSEHRK